MTVKQLLNNLDSVELTEWMAYFKLEKEFAKKKPDDLPVDQKIKNALRFKG